MTNLIDRIEGAEAGSEAMDAELFWLLERRSAERCYWNAAMGVPRPLPADFIPSGLGRIGVEAGSPPYTTSLDAALALAERVLPDETFWEIGHQSIISGDKMFWAAVYPPCATVERPMQDALSRTPALALCAAILRAKEQGNGDE